MSCERARAYLSERLDGEAASPDPVLDAHVADCTACRRYQNAIATLRRRVRYEAVDRVPDVTPAVLAAVAGGPWRRRTAWVAVAAAFIVGVVAGAVFVGLGRTPRVAAADIPDRVVEAQAGVAALTARIAVVEHGVHPLVPVRNYEGTFAYAAPETLWLHLEDTTPYPDGGWVPNDVDVVVDGDEAWAAGPVPCPAAALPGCTPPGRRVTATIDREPFPDAAPAPLDWVVPVRSFTGAAAPETLGERSVGGREAVGVAVTAAQVDPLLSGLFSAGNWREVHPTDRAELWLDRESYVPLELTVIAAAAPERTLWALRRGYPDEAGVPVLEIRWSEVTEGAGVPVDPPPIPEGAEVRRAGFTDAGLADPGPAPHLPAGFSAHRSGVVAVLKGPRTEVRTWSDGRAWVKVATTREWRGGRLFGDPGPVVRRAVLGDGFAYIGEGGRRISIHGADVDVAVTGSLDPEMLLEVAGSLGVTGVPIPSSWEEAPTGGLAVAAAELPGLVAPTALEGFPAPAVRAADGVVTIAYTGAGARGFLLVEAPGTELSPPLEPDVRTVPLRGTEARWSPERGVLEWTEGGLVVSLQSATLGLDELVAVTSTLEPVP